jgi:glucan biosynthesis protein C
VGSIPVTDTLPPSGGRRYDVDWLRVLAMGTIFLFHCARFFDYDDWHVKNLVLSHGLGIFVIFTAQWIMPLFFILSGIGAFYALGRRTTAAYVKERFLRLVVPLVFGIFTFVPPQVYIERKSHGRFDGGFFSFLPHYFDGMYGFGGNFAWMGLHLWYLEVLFVFSLITLPLFRAAGGATAVRLRARITSAGESPWGWLIFVVPLFFMELFVNSFPESFGIRSFGGWSPLTYLVFFVIGYVIAYGDGFGRTIERYRAAWLIMGGVASAVGLFLIETGLLNGLPRPVSLPIEVTLRVLNSWFWLAAIMGFGRRYLSFTNRALAHANEAVLPFYILHQTVIVVVAFFLVNWAVPVSVKYVALAAASFVVIMALYEGVIRRIGVFRFLFGMKGTRK